MAHHFVFAAFLLVAGPAAFAQDAPGTSADDADACQPDIHRLCDRFFPDETLVAKCLVDRRADLSRPCAEVLARPRVVQPQDGSRKEETPD